MALRRYARVRRNDIVAAAVAAVGVLAFGPLYGLLLAVAGSVLGLVYRSSRVDVEVMGRVPQREGRLGQHPRPPGATDRPRGPGAPRGRADLLGHRGADPRRRSSPRSRPRRARRALVLDLRGDQPDGHDQRRRARRPAGRAARARCRPLPRPRHVAGPPGAAPVGADGRDSARTTCGTASRRACARPGARTDSRTFRRAPASPTPRTFPTRSSSATRRRRSTSLPVVRLPSAGAAPARIHPTEGDFSHARNVGTQGLTAAMNRPSPRPELLPQTGSNPFWAMHSHRHDRAMAHVGAGLTSITHSAQPSPCTTSGSASDRRHVRTPGQARSGGSLAAAAFDVV